MTNKYISFSPYSSGFSNVVMSYEIAFAFAYLTKRTLILPPDAYILFHPTVGPGKKSFHDIWQLFDKEVARHEFDIVEHKDVPEFQGKLEKINTWKSYTGDIGKHFTDIFHYDPPPPHRFIHAGHQVFVNDLSKCASSDDFKMFSSNREIIDLNKSEQFLHFENNLFGHFWYHIYPGNDAQRNILKDKINKTFRYKQRYFDLAQQVKNRIGPFNAIHIRRNDFFIQYGKGLETVSTETKLLDEIDKIEKFKGLPLYISTDESNKDFFNEVRKKYNIYFYQDFGFELPKLDETIMEQVICSEAEFFLGTYLSTYTKRINLIRGLAGKQADDFMGINSVRNKTREFDMPLPWTMRESQRWHWNESSHHQWIKE